MNEKKLAGMLGLALRARQAALGMDACRVLIRSGECGILMVDSNTGPNTRRKAEELCGRTGTPFCILPAGLIETATGRENRVIAIRKGSFSEQVYELANNT